MGKGLFCLLVCREKVCVCVSSFQPLVFFLGSLETLTTPFLPWDITHTHTHTYTPLGLHTHPALYWSDKASCEEKLEEKV